MKLTYTNIAFFSVILLIFIQLNYWTFNNVSYGGSIIGLILILIFECVVAAWLLTMSEKDQ